MAAVGPSRHFGNTWNLVGIGRIADMARLAAGSTRLRMTQSVGNQINCCVAIEPLPYADLISYDL